jgi:hypothetical protein
MGTAALDSIERSTESEMKGKMILLTREDTSAFFTIFNNFPPTLAFYCLS